MPTCHLDAGRLRAREEEKEKKRILALAISPNLGKMNETFHQPAGVDDIFIGLQQPFGS
jgi:hypothetical protein